MDDETKARRAESNPWSALGLVGAVGLTVACCIVAGVLVGRFLEARLEAGGAVLALCIFAGVIAGLLSAGSILLGASGWKR